MLQRLNLLEFKLVYDIMKDSFPFHEIRSYTGQKELLRKQEYQIYIIKNETANVIKAMVAVYDFNEFLFIEHLAVAAPYRNEGLGSQILKELKTIFHKPLCLEVEPPINDLSTRRIHFYQRNGFFLQTYPYMQPALEKGKAPIPLMIMSTFEKMNCKEFENLKFILYCNVYHYLEK